MATFPAKTNYAAGDILTAAQMVDIGEQINALNGNAGKNKIINGDFAINQRAFTSSTTSGAYGFDRWRNQNAGGTVTYSAETFTPGTAPVSGYEARNYARVLTSGQSAVSDFSAFSQPIEDVRTFAGQTATLSFWAKAASGTPKIAIETEQAFGTGGSPSSDVKTYHGQITISTSWTRYSVTMSIPSISGKTIGTDVNSSMLRVFFWMSAGTNFNSRTGSLGVQNNTFDIWGVQVEAGNVATAFQTATGTLAGELAACQRYYFRWTATQAYSPMPTVALKTSATAAQWPVQHPVQMRGNPSALEFSTLAIANAAGTGAITATTGMSIGWTSPFATRVDITNASAGAGDTPAVISANNSTSAYFALSAEL